MQRVEDLKGAVIETSDGVSAFFYHNWLYPENTVRLTVLGSKKLRAYEGRLDKRAATLYEWAGGRQLVGWRIPPGAG